MYGNKTNRMRRATAACGCLLLFGVLLWTPTTANAFGETGGSGLVRIEQAYSLPIGRPLVSLYAGYYGNDFTPGTSRLFSFAPSLTLGLGGGFEAAGSLRYEGLSTDQSGEIFPRRYEIRRRTLLTKLRWTTDVGTPRLRAGLIGHFGIPFGEAQRPGSTLNPDFDMDRGLLFATSANFGWRSVPLRLHANLGYWWSRNDGAFYYQDHPFGMALPGADGEQNDVLQYGLALEAGLRRAVVFLELTSEQFLDARSSISSRENLWRLTPGVRTQLTSSVGLTGAVAFSLSSDDPATAFDPDGVYPEYEFRLGLTLGSVLSRESHEARRMARTQSGELVPLPPTEPGSWIVMDHSPLPADAPLVIVEEPVAAAAPAPAITAVPVVVAAPPARDVSDETLLRELERRLDRMETTQRLRDIENRLERMESRGLPVTPPSRPAPTLEPSSAPTASAAADTVVAAVSPDTVAPTADPASDPDQERMDRMLSDIDQALTRLATTPAETAPVTAAPVTAPAQVAVPTTVPEVQTPVVETPVVQAPVVQTPVAVPATPVAGLTVPARTVTSPLPATSGSDGGSTVIITDNAAPAAQRQAVQTGSALDPELSRPYTDSTAPVRLDPELLRPPTESVHPNTLPTPTPAPATAVETVPAPAAPTTQAAPVAQAAPPAFPIGVGERMPVADVALERPDPYADPQNRAALDRIAALLARHPSVQVAVLVHGTGAGRTAALDRSSVQAESLKNYLVVAGAGSDQVVPLGMGLAEEATRTSPIELERLR